MSDWLEIIPKEFSESEHVQIRGVSVEVFLSPFDMPEAVRGSYDKDAKKFLIEFRYIGGDEPLSSDSLEGATISIGKHSKRIYKIELEQVDLTNEQKVGLRLIPKVDAVLESLEHDRDSARRAGNYKVAKKIWHKWAEKLFQNQVAA
jgi:hypothetical protein